jgi:hypothetical protein
MLFDVSLLVIHPAHPQDGHGPAVTREPLLDHVKGHWHALTLIGSPNADL